MSVGVAGVPWAVEAADVASNCLETALGSHAGANQRHAGEFQLAGDDLEPDASPNTWSDGSLVVDKVSGVGVAGSGVHAYASGVAWFHRRWGHLDLTPSSA